MNVSLLYVQVLMHVSPATLLLLMLPLTSPQLLGDEAELEPCLQRGALPAAIIRDVQLLARKQWLQLPITHIGARDDHLIIVVELHHWGASCMVVVEQVNEGHQARGGA
eukprot:CAMPEP_0202921664 /NCGR_PEP_ID=MMETSP1392-20130828/77516_1 /ASSEMBLY_ACC=CAM_ASM_000868 /TAXON_ID=225041 /ORGANISM="Chlamydomonas chlamydogama, Strain SAG 11-48b" /LENGTH=108 /DNA_ID=CAMNT_0049615251 /DNA_START=361 /DNA_END=687 /DNA_ORIENTATION=+